MTDGEKDVKEEKETPSDPSAEENKEDSNEAEDEPYLDESEEEESEDELEEETSEEEEETEDESEEEESELEAELRKEKEKNQNLNKALAEERGKTRKVTEPPQPRTGTTSPVSKDEDPLSKKLIAGNEREGLKRLYSDFPELAPENDPGNELFTKFQRGYKVLVEADGGDIPITVEEIYAKGQEVMNVLSPSSNPTKKKAQIKADMANVGKSSKTQKKSKVSSTEADKKAAAAVGMSLESYLENKDTFEQDDIPI